MSQYLEFVTDDQNIHVQRTLGNAVHNEVVPPASQELTGLRIDGVPVVFEDETIPDRIHRALINGRKRQAVDRVFDCGVFAALMHGVDVQDKTDFPFEEVSVQEVADIQQSTLLLKTELGDRRHVIIPAKTLAPALRATYVHKLGQGPVCLSPLPDTFRIHGATGAVPLRLKD